MKHLLTLLVFFISISVFAQEDEELTLDKKADTTKRKSLRGGVKEDPKAPITWYKIYTIKKDTVHVDTTLTVKSEYKHNYLRKDNFGLLPFANDGLTYNTLDFSLNNFSELPALGANARSRNYYTNEQIKYYHVPTPVSDLYFKTVYKQGQNVDALVAMNTSKQLNFSVSYKGLRSLGKYINQLASTGNFVFTSSYNSKNQKYFLNFHYAGQDQFNQENGGLLDVTNFSSGDVAYKNRARIDVLFEDASSMYKGKRYFIDHNFALLKRDNYKIALAHQGWYETSYYEFKKSSETDYFGDSYLAGNNADNSRLKAGYNKLGAFYSSEKLGKLGFFVSNYHFNYFYERAIFNSDFSLIPNKLEGNLNTFEAQYHFENKSVKGIATLNKSFSNQNTFSFKAEAQYSLNEKNKISANYESSVTMPDFQKQLFQSSFINYNWNNNFKNEKINAISGVLTTKWATVGVNYKMLTDYIYYSNLNTADTIQLVKPIQYSKTINYLSVKGSNEFKFGKFGLDNTVLFQQVAQQDNVVNVPKFITRNTLYYKNFVFKKAMELQTGVVFQYFTKYNANAYNPVLGEFYTQNNFKMGGFPMMDFFVNARVKQARIFLKAEHFNSGFGENNHFSAPNYPYTDFVIRFGINWNFFK